jgi:hypothetical protein
MSAGNGHSPATKREIRRAMGSAAVETIGQHEDALAELLGALKAHGWTLAELTHRTARHDLDVAKLQTLTYTHDLLLKHLDSQPTLPTTFWGRLRWLLTGKGEPS